MVEDYLQIIQSVQFTDANSSHVEPCFNVLAAHTKALTSLVLVSCEWLEDAALSQILRNNANLKKVCLTNSNNITAVALQPMLGEYKAQTMYSIEAPPLTFLDLLTLSSERQEAAGAQAEPMLLFNIRLN